jgi:hypothetical protein
MVDAAGYRIRTGVGGSTALKAWCVLDDMDPEDPVGVARGVLQGRIG